MEQEREEGEMSDDTEMIVDDDEGPELVNDKSSLVLHVYLLYVRALKLKC